MEGKDTMLLHLLQNTIQQKYKEYVLLTKRYFAIAFVSASLLTLDLF